MTVIYRTRPSSITTDYIENLIILGSCPGEKLDGFDGEAAAQKLRGRVGTSVSVKLYSVTKNSKLILLNSLLGMR